MASPGVVQTPQTRPDPKQPQRRVSVSSWFTLPTGAPRPLALERIRALGQTVLLRAPGGLDHERALGATQVAKGVPPRPIQVRDTSALFLRRDATGTTRAIFSLPVTLGRPGALEHDRIIGNLFTDDGPPVVIGQPSPVSLVSARALGAATVVTPLTPVPLALVRGREVGLLSVSGSFVPPLPEPSRIYWSRSLRGVQRKAARR